MKLRLLRYDIAGWLMNLVWDGKSDVWSTHPKTVRLANFICPGGIPDTW